MNAWAIEMSKVFTWRDRCRELRILSGRVRRRLGAHFRFRGSLLQSFLIPNVLKLFLSLFSFLFFSLFSKL
jgi:hypothetical protein